jgi:hypothetical protein
MSGANLLTKKDFLNKLCQGTMSDEKDLAALALKELFNTCRDGELKDWIVFYFTNENQRKYSKAMFATKAEAEEFKALILSRK